MGFYDLIDLVPGKKCSCIFICKPMLPIQKRILHCMDRC